jgi:hypothetical protein
MKCYYLAKELNNCLSMMNVLIGFVDEEDEDEDKGY